MPRYDLLTLLADHLENSVKPEEFDMNYWSHKTGCGTVGCAIGHAYSLKEFRKAGLYLVDDYPIYDGFCPVYHDASCVGFDTIARCLDITKSAAYYLFDPARYEEEESCGEPGIKPKDIANRIRAFIRESRANDGVSS